MGHRITKDYLEDCGISSWSLLSKSGYAVNGKLLTFAA
jgi:hypothetical protein